MQHLDTTNPVPHAQNQVPSLPKALKFTLWTAGTRQPLILKDMKHSCGKEGVTWRYWGGWCPGPFSYIAPSCLSSPLGIPVAPCWAAHIPPQLWVLFTFHSVFSVQVISVGPFSNFPVCHWLFLSVIVCLFSFLVFLFYSYSFYSSTDIPPSALTYYPPLPLEHINHDYFKFLFYYSQHLSLVLYLMSLALFSFSLFLPHSFWFSAISIDTQQE